MPITCQPRPISSNASAANWPLATASPKIQDVFGKIFNAGTEFERDGSQFDRLLRDEDELAIGALSVKRHAHARPHAGLHDLS